MKSVKERLYEYFCGIFRREIIRDGFRGVLGRDPEEEALKAYEGSLPGLGVEGLLKDLATSSEAWEKQKQAHAEELIRAAYQGVLGRDPEEEALRAYEQSLPGIGVNGLTKDLANSEESWEKQKSAHAEELIRQFYKSLLGREPDPQGMETYRRVIVSKGINEILERLIQSDESWNYTTSLNPRELLRILYRGILEREADEAGVAVKAEKIRNKIPWEEVITEMLRSPEFLARQGSLLKSYTRGPWDDFLEEITDYLEYHIHLNGKAPGRDEIAAFIASKKKVRDLKRERLNGELKNPATLKVLLIGAYGNGNLGDAYQALAVEQQIKECYRIPEENIFAASHSNGAAFPFAPERILTREQLMDPVFMNTFGMIVIGGGGLFAHPHAPLRDKDQWCQSIQTPIIIHAVGASRKILLECRNLIIKAVEMSGRDEESVKAFNEFRQDCKLEKDPILMSRAPHELERYDEASSKEHHGERIDCLWILKYPANEKDREALEVIKGIIGEDNKIHQIIAIEPALDNVLEKWFPGMVHYCTFLTDLNGFISRSEKVISMRYHGAIFGILNKKTTYGFSQIKIQSILKARIDYIDMDLYKRFNDLLKIK